MKIVITGACGFVGSTLAASLLERQDSSGDRITIVGLDNLSRAGSEINRAQLIRRGVRVVHGDLRCREDLDQLGACDWVIDAAANPSVLAGVDGQSSSQQVFDHNLSSTIHLLEYCKKHRAGFTLLSTSRVYSIKHLAGLPMKDRNNCFCIDDRQKLPHGASVHGIAETFSVEHPISLYGASKLASELIALEYGDTFKFPVWINRCGVLAGAGQFGRPDQGIFSFWINAYLRRRPLKYIGFGGHGWQARDALHPNDLLPLLHKQWAYSGEPPTRIFNLGGGQENTFSLRQLSDWCAQKFGEHAVSQDSTPRQFDIPWMVMDARQAGSFWGWKPKLTIVDILEEIAQHAENNPNWLAISGVV